MPKCQQKDSPMALGYLLASVHRKRANRPKSDEKYWYWRVYEAEVEWVCNVVSAIGWDGYDDIVTPTARGILKANEVLKAIGVE